MKHRYIIWITLITILVATVIPSLAQYTGQALFNPLGNMPRGAEMVSPQSGTLRQNFATINTDALLSAGKSIDSPLTFNLFNDVALSAINTRTEARSSGASGYVWTGKLVGQPTSDVILAIDGNNISGRIISARYTYYIQPLGNGTHRISEIDTARVMKQNFDDAIQAPPSSVIRNAPNALDPRDTGEVIDLMVVYTPAAEAIFGGNEAAARLAIDEMVALTNQSYVNSHIKQRINLVHVTRVNYVEAPQNYVTDLSRLRAVSDGHMDGIHTLRDDYRADLVMMITGTPEAQRNYCGLGYLLSGNPEDGFTVAEAICAGTVVMPHELGHNMGSTHDQANSGGQGWFNYSYGYQDYKEDSADYGDFVTVMAYNRNGACPTQNALQNIGEAAICPHILYWSSPNQTFNGKVLGHEMANNVLTLNKTASMVANFRYSGNAPTPATSMDASYDGANVNLVWTNSTSVEQVEIERSRDGINFNTLITLNGAIQSYTDTQPECSSTYYYRVRAIKDGSSSVPSAPAQIITNACQWVNNGDFELSRPNPDGWDVKGKSKDKVRCNIPEKDKTFAFSGDCAFVFKGAEGERSRLKQELTASTLYKGDVLTVSSYITTRKASNGAKIMLKAKYANGTVGKEKIKLPTGTTAYQQYTFNLKLENVPNKVILQVKYANPNASGKIMVDQVSIARETPPATLPVEGQNPGLVPLPLPAAP